MTSLPLPTQDAVDFSSVQFWLWVLRTLLGLSFPSLLLLSGAAQRWSKFCEDRAGRNWILAPLGFGASYTLLYALIVRLPMDYLQTHWLAPYIGVPSPALLTWLPTQISSTLELVFAGVLAGGSAAILLRISPRRSWLLAATALTVVAVTYLAFVPLQSARASGRYVPLDNPQWQTRFAGISQRVHLKEVPVLVWKTTERDICRTSNTTLGLGSRQVIVLADRIFEQWPPEMIEAAYAHELKHYFLDNGWKATSLVVALMFAGAATIYAVMKLGLAWLSGRNAITSSRQPAVLVLLALGLQLFLLIEPPAVNLLSQEIEFEADRFSLELTHHNEARVRIASEPCGRLWLPEETLFRQLYVNNHPDMATRVRFASSYRPWETGTPLVYARYMQ